MEQGKKNKLYARLLGLPENADINFKFNPNDNSVLKIAWNSPVDKKANLVNFLLNGEPYIIRIRDNH